MRQDHSNRPGELPEPGGRRTRTALVFWCPREIARPRVESDLSRLGPVERSAEVIRYSLCRAEYWISPNGWLREWFRINLWAAIMLAIPAVLVAPLGGYLLERMAAGSGLMAEVAKNLAQLPEVARSGVVVVAAVAVIFVLKVIFR